MGVAAAPKKKYLPPMTNTKNLLIAILTGLLALSLFTQPAQSAGKTYDAVKMAEYTACLDAQNNFQIALMHANGGNGDLRPRDNLLACKTFKP
jgi:hypothetical protein